MKSTRWLAALLLSVALLLTVACGSSEPEAEAPPVEEPAAETAKLEPPAEEAEPTPAPEPVVEEPAAPAPQPKAAPKKAEPAGPPMVVVQTSKGAIKIELYPDKAPETVENFMAYVNAGYYDGTIFHRVIPDFMIQGGGFTPDMEKKETREPVKNEAKNGLKNERGTIAMARTFMPHSATSQFFINHVNNAMLDNSEQNGWGYCVFGKVVEGMDVVDAIAAVATKNEGPYQNVPVTPVVIQSIKPAS